MLSWRGRGGGGDQIFHFSVLTNGWKKGKNRQNKLKKKTQQNNSEPPEPSPRALREPSPRGFAAAAPLSLPTPQNGAKHCVFNHFPPLPRCPPGELRPRGWILLPPHPLRPLPPSPRGPAQVWGRTPSFGDFFLIFIFFCPAPCVIGFPVRLKSPFFFFVTPPPHDRNVVFEM